MRTRPPDAVAAAVNVPHLGNPTAPTSEAITGGNPGTLPSA
ncbi:hypothetical protein [Actinorhabdospora filicis]|nr:hypothetical protein [Actinorhabdospora filicis]